MLRQSCIECSLVRVCLLVLRVDDTISRLIDGLDFSDELLVPSSLLDLGHFFHAGLRWRRWLLIPHVAVCKPHNIWAKVAFALHFPHLTLLGDTLRVGGATSGLSQAD